jgi:dihydrofolate synthase/folylpolyglutamate synthase
MNYLETLAYLESLTPTILNPGLTRFAAFMQKNGNSQDKFPSIHVAGTNGKGSTVAIIESVLRASGLKTGRYTGPHLLRWNERFHVAGVPIDDAKFSNLATDLRLRSEAFGQANPELGALTWFEFLTALAFEWFAENKVDVAVIEVGLGGRWDATNVLTRPLVSAITTIDFDHMHILGPTLAEIAGEKAGIIKSQVPVVTSAEAEALDAIANRATECGVPLYVVSEPSNVTVRGADAAPSLAMEEFRAAMNTTFLSAKYQQLNALVSYMVLALAEQKLSAKLLPNFAAGSSKVYWPGRYQYVAEENLLLDGAHNPGGAKALRRSLDVTLPERQRIFVLSFFENKNVLGALQLLLREGDRVFVSEAKTHRAVCKAEAVVTWAKQLGAFPVEAPTIADAFRLAQQARSGDDLIIATGSFATVKECMLALGWTTVEDGRPLTSALP